MQLPSRCFVFTFCSTAWLEISNDVQRSEIGVYMGTRDGNLKHSMGIPSFTVCIDMNILETSLDEGHLYFY